MNAISKKPYVPSPQQKAVFDFVSSGRGSAIVEAVAGAGKTTTLAHAIGLMHGTVCAMAFNKAAAAELKQKVRDLEHDRKGIRIGTCHSAGWGAWTYAYKHCVLNENKVRDIVTRMAEAGRFEAELCREFIERLVSIGTQCLAGVDWPVTDRNRWWDLVEHYGIDDNFPEGVPMEQALDMAIEVFERSAAMCTKECSFDDMLYAPIRFKLRMFQVDWVILDEAQDSNPARRRLARMMLKPTGRFIACGDSRQAIYGFSGASSDSLDCLRRDFGCITLPLTITYRCPKTVVEYARTWVSHITAADTAPQGEVMMVQVAKDSTDRWFKGIGATDAVLCRYTKPLVQNAYALLKEGIACKVEGRDIGRGLIALASRWKVKSLNALEDKLETWLAKEVTKARAAQSEAKEQAARDKVETLAIFIKRCRDRGADTVNCLKEEIEALFADDVTGCTTFCSIHRSKGREWPTVWSLSVQLKARRELKPHEAIQEENLKYVEATRAQSVLRLVPESLHS